MNILLVISVILLVDILWINFVMKSRYNNFVRSITSKNLVVDYKYAAFTYLIMAVSIVVLLPKLVLYKKSLEAYTNAALLGLTVYGVYAGTVKAILPKFKVSTMILDTAWGSFIYTFAAFLIRLR